MLAVLSGAKKFLVGTVLGVMLAAAGAAVTNIFFEVRAASLLLLNWSRSRSRSRSHLATDGQSVCLSVLVSSPVWGSWPDINYCLTVTVLSWGGRPLWREDGSVVCQLASSRVWVWVWVTELDITRVALYSLRTDHAQKTRLYCCVRNIAPWTSHVTPSQYCWSVTSCACVEVCLSSRNLERDCVIPLFHCRYVYYLETAGSVAQPFLHGANTTQYSHLEAVSIRSLRTLHAMVTRDPPNMGLW
jgi:hypothetical protein